ncbi:MAG: site-2 protease family protein [Microthrixaceae bacterium]
MRSHLTLGRLFGVPIGINLWVMAVAAVLAVSLAQISLPNIAPDHPRSAYWFAGVVGVAGFLASLVAHEVGHSWVAQRNNVRVREITLWLFGGVAKLEGDADDPGSEFRIALAGPAMSALCSLVLAGAAWEPGGSRDPRCCSGCWCGCRASMRCSPFPT